MKLSIIIPAFNEEKVIETCVLSMLEAVRANGREGLRFEVIVVDNNSSDATASLARKAGAEVVFERVNSFSGARNRGASVASGEWLIFVDADTIVRQETLADALREIECGKAVGGASTVYYGKVKWNIWLFAKASNVIIRALKLTPGFFVFCRAEAFRGIGGFDEKFLAGEDADFSARLGRWGKQRGLKVKVLHKHPAQTSARKFHLYGFREILTVIARCVLFPKKTMQDKRHLRMFYDGKR